LQWVRLPKNAKRRKIAPSPRTSVRNQCGFIARGAGNA
jgi:hypothetical protein